MNPVMLDCVIRVDEPNIPTVKEILDECKKNPDNIPEVNLNRKAGAPLYPGIEKRLEELCFVKAFPYGKNGCDENRKIKIIPLDYFQTRILSCNLHFHTTKYIFYALSRVEAHIIQQKIAVVGNVVANDGNVGQNEDNRIAGFDNIHLYMQAIRGSAAYWGKYKMNVLGLIEQLGDPTFFLTISYDDLNSVDALTALWKAKHGFAEELPFSPAEMTYDDRKDLLNEQPIAAARHFHNRMNIIIDLLRKHSVSFWVQASRFYLPNRISRTRFATCTLSTLVRRYTTLEYTLWNTIYRKKYKLLT